MRNVTLKQLRCFLEVCHSRGVAQAANVLGITQSAASRRIADLETALQVVLFDRQGRKLLPNARARLLMRFTQDTMKKLNTGLELVTGTSRPERRELGIGALPTVAGTLVPQVVGAMRVAAPGLLIRVETGAGNQLLPRLKTGQLDAVIGRMAPVERLQGLHFEPLYQDRLGFVVRYDHPLAGGGGIILPDLAPYPMIVPPPGTVIRPIVEAFLASRGAALPDDRIETTAESFAIPMLLATNSIWVISRGVAEGAVAEGRLAFLALDTADTIGAIGLTRRAHEDLTPELLLLHDFLRAGQNPA